MSITFEWGNVVKASKRDIDPEYCTGSVGVIPKEVVIEMAHKDNKGTPRPGIVIELRESNSEIPDEQYLRIASYGITWRAWYGDPLPEQMQAEPWEGE